MTGETNLASLLSSLSPELMAGEFVFCTVKNISYAEAAGLSPLASFHEREGLTLVLPRGRADGAGIDYAGVFSCITLRVHSSLDAVGLTAAVSGKLADRGISANVVAAYYHDHIFVPCESAAGALAALQEFGSL